MIELADDSLLSLIDGQGHDAHAPAPRNAAALHSVIVAVHDVEEALARMGRLFVVDDAVRVTEDDVVRAFLPTGPHFLQFVAPRGAASSEVSRHLKDRGEGAYAVGVVVVDVQALVDRVQDADARVVVAPGAGGEAVTVMLPGALRVEARQAWPVAPELPGAA